MIDDLALPQKQLWDAGDKGNVEAMEALLRRPDAALYLDWRNPGDSDSTALMQASYAGRTSCVAALLQAGADVDAVDKVRADTAVAPLLPQRTSRRPARLQKLKTALMWAATNGKEACVGMLLDAGVDTAPRDLVRPVSKPAARVRAPVRWV